jgi:transposase
MAVGRKNALFAGADSGGEHWALIATLIQTAKLNEVDPLAWLTDVLERIVSGRTKRNELHTLLPWNWTSAKPVTSSA